MSEEAGRRVYAVLVAALFAAVALARRDLFVGAWEATVWTLSHGGPARWKILGEIILLSGILAAAWLTIPGDVRPAHDAAVFLLAAALGWLAEAWGTRAGVWRYYTGEQPPLWIVPVWPLGAALVERAARQAQARWGPAPRARYWLLAAAAAAVCVIFPWICVGADRRMLLPAAAAAGLFIAARPEDDFWLLAVGIGCVFFADLWGTTNGCWAYYTHGRPWGLWAGIGFGMCFDAAAVLACLRLTRALRL